MRPNYQTALNLCLTFPEEVHEEERSNWQLAGITDRGINIFNYFSYTSYIFLLL